MKTLKVFILVLLLTGYKQDVNAQSVKVIKTIPVPANSDMYVYNSDSVFYLNTSTKTSDKTTILKPNGVQVPNPKELVFKIGDEEVYEWTSLINGDEKIVITQLYEGTTFKVYGFKVSIATNTIIGPGIKLAEVESEDFPEFIVSIPENNSFVGFMIQPRNLIPNKPGITFEVSYAMIFVFNNKLEEQWKRRIDYDDKLLYYNLQDGLGNDGTWYTLNGIKESKSETSTRLVGYQINAYGSSLTLTDVIDVSHNIKSVIMTVEKDGIMFIGLKGAPEEEYEFANGSFMAKYDLATLEEISFRVDDFSVETMEKFMTNNFLRKQMEKGRGVANMQLYPVYFTFEDGTIAIIMRHVAPKETGSAEYDYGTIMAVLYGKDASSYSEAIIRLNQRSVYFGYTDYAVSMVGDKLYIFFNDSEENSGKLSAEMPDLFYSPVLLAPANTTTEVVVIDSKANATRLKVADFKDDQFIMYNGMISQLDEIPVFLISGVAKATIDGKDPKYLLVRIND